MQRFNPETTPLKQWPFLYDDDDHHWYLDWSEFVGVLLVSTIFALVIGAIGFVLYTGLVSLP